MQAKLGGKHVFAANPWPLAAEAKKRGLPTGGFHESDLVPEGHAYIVDVDALVPALADRLQEFGEPRDAE